MGGTLTWVDWALAGAGVGLGLAGMAVDHLLGDDPGLEDPPAFLISASLILVVTTLLFALVGSTRARTGSCRLDRGCARNRESPPHLAGSTFRHRSGRDRLGLERRWTASECGNVPRRRCPVARNGGVRLRRDRQTLCLNRGVVMAGGYALFGAGRDGPPRFRL